MILNVLVTRDRKLSVYGTPVYTTDDPKIFLEHLKRSIIGRPMQNIHLADCELYLLGEYDDEKGTFKLKEQAEYIEDLRQFFPENIEAVIDGIQR